MSTYTGYIKFVNKPDKIRKNWSVKMMGDDTLYISRKPLDEYKEGDEIVIEYRTNKAGFNWIDKLDLVEIKQEGKSKKSSPDQAAWRDSIRENLNTLRDSAGTPYTIGNFTFRSSDTVTKGSKESSEDLPTRVGITSDTAVRLAVIRKRTDTATNAEVVRNLVRLFDTIINEFDKGNELLPSYMLGAMGIDRRKL
jgi:hypothetical protein